MMMMMMMMMMMNRVEAQGVLYLDGLTTTQNGLSRHSSSRTLFRSASSRKSSPR